VEAGKQKRSSDYGGSTLEYEAVVLIADGTVDQENDSISIENVSFTNPVRVVKDFGIKRPIGKAVLSVKGKTLVAKISIPFADEMNHGPFKDYIPSIGGGCDPVKPDGNKVRTITNLRIYEIALTEKPNSDPRIKSLVEQFRTQRVESR
jgi:hypothetical protein